jgi:hypothetical protein
VDELGPRPREIASGVEPEGVEATNETGNFSERAESQRHERRCKGSADCPVMRDTSFGWRMCQRGYALRIKRDHSGRVAGAFETAGMQSSKVAWVATRVLG